MKETNAFVRAFAALIVATAIGCASGAPAAESVHPYTDSSTGENTQSLEPTAADLRTAARAELTGHELGALWPLEDAPVEAWRQTRDFDVDAAWLDHVRLASLRWGEYCSAAFVSSGGLAITNQHCVRACTEAISSGRDDFVQAGFLAESRREERLCPGAYVDQLVSVEDVTDRIRESAAAEVDPVAKQAGLGRVRAELEEECETEPGTVCQVVTLWGGARYRLYRYRRYDQIRLVFAPDLQAAWFGGEFDNFTYPRYALDIGFVRVYESDGRTPVRPASWFSTDPEGAVEGEPVFVVGNPGSTSRLATVSQLMYERTVRLPVRIQVLNAQMRLLEAYATTDEELAPRLRQDRFEVSNSLKAYEGQLEGLRDSLLVGTKIRWEQEFRAGIAASPELRQEYGDVWDRMAALQRRKLAVSPRLNATNVSLVGSPHLGLAAELVDYVRQMQLPESERRPQLRGDAARRFRVALETDVAVDPAVAWISLTGYLRYAEMWLAADDPLRRALMRPDETVEQAAERLLADTKILNTEFRHALIEGGDEAIAASDDPLIAFARRANDEAGPLRAEWNAITAAEAEQERRLGQALVALHGTTMPPDATFTLRISDGVVKRYPYNGTMAPPATTFLGLFARAGEFDGVMPWTLSSRFEKAKSRIDMDTPLDFVLTNDITGGSSGSPVIDRDGRLVGIIFDSNIEQLPNEFLYRTDTGRAIAVHSAGILEALRSVYHANALVSELTARRDRRE